MLPRSAYAFVLFFVAAPRTRVQGKEPHEDVDLRLVPCNASNPDMLWKLAPTPSPGPGFRPPPPVQIELKGKDKTDGDTVCVNCPRDRCHGWPCTPADRNNMYSVDYQLDGNFTLLSVGGGTSGWPKGLCLTSRTGGIGSKIEFATCADFKN